MLQRMDEGDFALAIVSEPYVVHRDHPHWWGNDEGTVAVVWRRSSSPFPCVPVGKGRNFAIVKWGDVTVIGVYISPTNGLDDFEQMMGEIERYVLPSLEGPLLLAGDFNAKARLWESPVTESKGTFLAEWASALGLISLNRGSTFTCSRVQGESIVDISFASVALERRVADCRVSLVYSASDHRYIELQIGYSEAQRVRWGTPHAKRWSVRRFVRDDMQAAISVAFWPSWGTPGEWDLDAAVMKLQQTMGLCADVAMPRVSPRPRRAVPWWSEELSRLRRKCTFARRQLKRSNRRSSQDD
ncbi:PREDICTED: uncharacterized protein LOC108782237 [Cyphomyrmex costatus]|uniref:uncharacterized protein LOC108782237 n=1 Tax=Cyphomyrmex costatus TaxID=456900 RepID=UPI000852347F|nr:PREDICTED: uncharacterized protein LOC108782237 [Cyphomyrmex costatus]